MVALPVESEITLARKLIHTRFHGHVTAADCAANVTAMQGLVGRVGPGFSLLVDFSDLERMDLDCAPHLSRVMDLCRDHQVGRIVRVIPDPRKDIGVNILSIIHYRGHVPTVVVETLAEADRALG